MANRKIESVGQALITESVALENAEALRGNVFEVTHQFTSVADGGTEDILIDPNGVTIGLAVCTSKSTQEGLITTAFEDPTVTEGEEGTELTVFCTNREIDNDETAVVTHSPTITDTGTELPSYATDLLGRYILDPDLTYLIRYENGHDTEAADIDVKIMWVEY